MKITDVETIWIGLPEVRLIADSTQQSLLVCIHTDEGIVGIGEAHTAPYIIKAIIESDSTGIVSQGIRSLLLGENPLEVERLWHKMYHYTSRHGRRGAVIHAISAVDMALWDILGKAAGLPVSTLLGGRYREEVKAYASVLMPDTPEEAGELAGKIRSRGFCAAKFGWETLGTDLAADICRVEAIRKAVGRDFDVMIDIGYGMEVNRAIKLAWALEDYDIRFLEEPLSPDDLEGFARLSEATSVPIATGEKETTRFGFLDLMERGRVGIIQPDIARAGGFTECRKIALLADLKGVELIPHCWSNDILVASTLHFLAARPQETYLEFCLLDSYNPIRQDMVCEPLRAVDGEVKVPTGPGLGVELNQEVVRKLKRD